MSIFKDNQKYILLSALLHGVGVLALISMWSKSNVPYGVARKGAAVIEFSVPGQPSVLPPVKTKAIMQAANSIHTDTPAAAIKKSRAVAPAVAAQQLGFADGTRSMAQIGQAGGTANAEKDRYIYELRVLIEQKKIYPQTSERLREAGRVIVRFQVLKDGRINAVDLKSASTYSRLNEAALRLVREIERFKPLPQEVLNDQASLEIQIPIEYVLN